jgi:hypothetical protein
MNKKKYTNTDFKKDIEATEKWEDEIIEGILTKVAEIVRDIKIVTNNPALSIDEFLNLPGIKNRILEHHK